jgi:hypothetical protein
MQQSLYGVLFIFIKTYFGETTKLINQYMYNELYILIHPASTQKWAKSVFGHYFKHTVSR